MAAALVALEDREQRRVLARVVAVRRGGSTPWSAVRTSRSPGPSSAEPPADRRVDPPAAPGEARDVVAVAVHLVGLDEVREDQAGVEVAQSSVVAASPSSFVVAVCLRSIPTPANRSRILPTRAPARRRPAARRGRSAGRLEREVAPPAGAGERAGLAVERAARSRGRPRARRSSPRAPPRTPRAAPARPARRRARRAGAPSRPTCRGSPRRSSGGARRSSSMTAVPLQGCCSRSAARSPPRGARRRRAGSRRVGRQRRVGDDAHELPVPGRRVLAGAERVQPAVERPGRRRAARPRSGRSSRARGARASAGAGRRPPRRRARACSRPSVAVVGGVGQLAHAAGVEDDHGGAARRTGGSSAAGFCRICSERSSGRKKRRRRKKKKKKILVVGDANPDLLLSGDVVPRFGQAEQDVEAAVALGGSGLAAALPRLGVGDGDRRGGRRRRSRAGGEGRCSASAPCSERSSGPKTCASTCAAAPGDRLGVGLVVLHGAVGCASMCRRRRSPAELVQRAPALAVCAAGSPQRSSRGAPSVCSNFVLRQALASAGGDERRRRDRDGLGAGAGGAERPLSPARDAPPPGARRIPWLGIDSPLRTAAGRGRPGGLAGTAGGVEAVAAASIRRRWP